MGLITAFVSEAIEKEIVVKISCDLCGREYKPSLSIDNDQDIDNEYAHVKWTAGFGSRYDMTSFSVALCDGCMALLSTPNQEREALQKTVQAIHHAKAEVEEL